MYVSKAENVIARLFAWFLRSFSFTKNIIFETFLQLQHSFTVYSEDLRLICALHVLFIAG